MNKKVKTLCAAMAIALLPIGATCYAQNSVEEKYETIWMEAEQKVEKKETKETLADCSLDEMVKLKDDKAKYEANVGKEVVIKIKVTKITVEGTKTHIVTKTGPLQKVKCTLDNSVKIDMSKYKAGDELVVKGTLKDIQGKTVVLENSTILKDMGPSNELNKDKYKNNTQENKTPEIKKEEIKKPDVKTEENNKKEEMKKPDVKMEENNKVDETKKPNIKTDETKKEDGKKMYPSMEHNKNEDAVKNKCKNPKMEKEHEMKEKDKNKCKKQENKVEIKNPQENKKEHCPREQE